MDNSNTVRDDDESNKHGRNSSDDTITPTFTSETISNSNGGSNQSYSEEESRSFRTRVQEEIHGVGCVCPNETPELLRTSLQRLSEILDSDDQTLIPEKNKQAYRKARKIENSYVNKDDFKLRFLRADLFHVPNAAKRLIKYLEVVDSIFGSYALERPIRLDDFGKDELKLLKQGHIQFLPFRDRSGRRVMVIIASDALNTIGPIHRLKVFLYFLYSAGTNDIDAQRRGIVFVIWMQCANGFRTIRSNPNYTRTNLGELRPLRLTALHICTSDTMFNRLFRRLIMTTAGTFEVPPNMDGDEQHFVVSRFRVHLGEPVELHYALQSYGIPTDKIPITFSGVIKLAYFSQWLWIRQYIEDGLNDIVECPGVHDVIVRQGSASSYHPGNARFFDLIQRKLQARLKAILVSHTPPPTPQQQNQQEQQQESWTAVSNNTTTSSYYQAVKNQFKPTPRLIESIVSEMIQAIQETSGRMLSWYDNKGYGCTGWWKVLDRPEQMRTKVEYFVLKEFRKVQASIAKEYRSHKRKVSSSVSTLATSATSATRGAVPAAFTAASLKPTNSTTNMQVEQVLESDTSIFRSQDGTTGTKKCDCAPMDCDGT